MCHLTSCGELSHRQSYNIFLFYIVRFCGCCMIALSVSLRLLRFESFHGILSFCCHRTEILGIRKCSIDEDEYFSSMLSWFPW